MAVCIRDYPPRDHSNFSCRDVVRWHIIPTGWGVLINMKPNRLLRHSMGRGLLLSCLLIIRLGSFAQSLDDVHVQPRNMPDKPVSIVDDIPIEGLPTLDAHMRPLKVDVDLVLVPVTVTDTMSRPITTLKKQDFALYEEDKPQEIRYFFAEEAPISVAVLLDVSQSMTDKIDVERAAVAEFFKNAHPQDEYFVIAFSDRPRLLARSTQSIDDIEKKLMATTPGEARGAGAWRAQDLGAIFFRHATSLFGSSKNTSIIPDGTNAGRSSLFPMVETTQAAIPSGKQSG